VRLIENLINDALASGDEATMREALKTLKCMAEPYLNWTGKAERTSFDIDLVSLHVHERIDPATILTSVKKRMREGASQGASQGDTFCAWFEEPLPYREAIEFYKHEAAVAPAAALSSATSQFTSSISSSVPPADSTCSRYLPLTTIDGVRSTLHALIQ
jgi:hypothetical protein